MRNENTRQSEVSYYCTCQGAKKSRHHVKFALTEVHSDTTCVHCGYYAVATCHDFTDKNYVNLNQLNFTLSKHEVEEPKYVAYKDPFRAWKEFGAKIAY